MAKGVAGIESIGRECGIKIRKIMKKIYNRYMNKKYMHQGATSGFVGVTILMIAALAGVMYVVKDEKGVSYLESTYKEVHYLIKGRSEEAIEKAKDAKQIMQKRQNEIQKNIDSL